MSSYPPPPPGQGGGPSYPPPPGGQPPWGGGYGASPSDNRATWALVIGIVSIVLTCCCGPLSIAGGIVAIVLAKQVHRQAEQYGQVVPSNATAGFWVGVVAVALGALSMLSSIVFTVLDLWAF